MLNNAETTSSSKKRLKLKNISSRVQFNNKINKSYTFLLFGRNDKYFPNKYYTFGLTFQNHLL